MSSLGKKYSGSKLSAFTLVELLVVIGLIALLAGGIGLTMRGGNPSTSVRGAQGTMTSALAAARGQAALSQTDAMIIVQANKDDPSFLRSIKIVVESPAGSNQWKEVGGEILLPESAYIVPNVTSLSGATLAVGDALRMSSFFETTGPVTNVSGTYLRSKKITALGAVDGGGRVLVAAGQRTAADAVTLDNKLNVRGLIISRYGVAAQVGESESFDF